VSWHYDGYRKTLVALCHQRDSWVWIRLPFSSWEAPCCLQPKACMDWLESLALLAVFQVSLVWTITSSESSMPISEQLSVWESELWPMLLPFICFAFLVRAMRIEKDDKTWGSKTRRSLHKTQESKTSLFYTTLLVINFNFSFFSYFSI